MTNLKLTVLKAIKHNKILYKIAKIIEYFFVKRKKINNLHNYGYETLKKLDELFSQNNITYWIEFGTLLGFIRDKGFIEHDDDIDIGILVKDLNDVEKIYEVIKNSNDFKLIKEYYAEHPTKIIKNIVISYKGLVQIDLFLFHLINDNIYGFSMVSEEGKLMVETYEKLGGYLVKENEFTWQGVTKINEKNIKINIPENFEEHLYCVYGNNWQIKDKNYVSPYISEDRKMRILKGVLGQVKIF